MAHFILGHGIRKKGQGNPMWGLCSLLEEMGHKVDLIDYGYILVPLDNMRARRAFKRLATPDSIFVGYSNGGYAAATAIDNGAPCAGFVLVSAAMRADWEPPEGLSHRNFYNPADRWLSRARKYRQVVNLLPHRWGSPLGWGEMGKTGGSHTHNVKLPESAAHTFWKCDKSLELVLNGCLNVAEEAGV